MGRRRSMIELVDKLSVERLSNWKLPRGLGVRLLGAVVSHVVALNRLAGSSGSIMLATSSSNWNPGVSSWGSRIGAPAVAGLTRFEAEAPPELIVVTVVGTKERFSSCGLASETPPLRLEECCSTGNPRDDDRLLVEDSFGRSSALEILLMRFRAAKIFFLGLSCLNRLDECEVVGL